MRMTGADTDPDNFRPTLAGKCSQADKGKEKGFPGNRAQLFHQSLLSFARHVSEKTQRQMHLPRLEPAHAAQVRIYFGETLPDGFRKLQTNEEPLRSHRLQPGSNVGG